MSAVLGGGHSAIADFQHVRIVPVPRPGVGFQSDLFVHDVEHAVAAAIARTPLFLSRPAILNVIGGAPPISAALSPPKPWTMTPPLADAQHNRTPACIQRLANICIRSSRILA